MMEHEKRETRTVAAAERESIDGEREDKRQRKTRERDTKEREEG